MDILVKLCKGSTIFGYMQIIGNNFVIFRVMVQKKSRHGGDAIVDRLERQMLICPGEHRNEGRRSGRNCHSCLPSDNQRSS